MVMIPCFDNKTGEQLPDADIDATEWQQMDDTFNAKYPPGRLNPWCAGDFMLNGEMTTLYIRREGGVYTEISVIGPSAAP